MVPIDSSEARGNTRSLVSGSDLRGPPARAPKLMPTDRHDDGSRTNSSKLG